MRNHRYWFAAATLSFAVAAGGVTTLYGAPTAGSSGSGDDSVTERYRPTLASGRPSPEEAHAAVAYVQAVKADEDARFLAAAAAAAAAKAEEEAAAARAAAARRAAAAAAPSEPKQSSEGSTANYSDGDWGKWTPILACESGGNWAYNDGTYYGGLNFARGTWTSYGGGAYASTADQATPSQQIEIAEKVLIGQGWGAWPACSRKAGYR